MTVFSMRDKPIKPYVLWGILLPSLLLLAIIYVFRKQAYQLFAKPAIDEQRENASIKNTSYKPETVIVTFEQGTTYKQAKELLETYDISQYKVDAMLHGNLKDDSVLSPVVLFTATLKKGLERETEKALNQEEIVQRAWLHYYSSGADID